MLQQHFVTFSSPGTLVAEQTTKPIAAWDVELATTMAHDIVERYNTKPFAFQFSTRQREDDELDSKIVALSGFYYLGGLVLSLDEVKARPGIATHDILIRKMEANGWQRIIVNDNSWRWAEEAHYQDLQRPPAPPP